MVDISAPMNWPKSVPIPSREEIDISVRKGEQIITQRLAERRRKLLSSDPAMDSVKITI